MERHLKRPSEMKSRVCFGFTTLHPCVMGEPRLNNPKWCLLERSVSKWLVDRNTSGVREQNSMFVSLQK